jgi:CCR4-NOT complex subunit CAF16
MQNASRSGSRLLELALGWLKEDRRVREEHEAKGELRKRGARQDNDVPSDSEAFFRR